MNARNLIDTARALVADDKGLLAMDESTPTCNKRFAKLKIPQTEKARRACRELIVTAPSIQRSYAGVSIEATRIKWHVPLLHTLSCVESSRLLVRWTPRHRA